MRFKQTGSRFLWKHGERESWKDEEKDGSEENKIYFVRSNQGQNGMSQITSYMSESFSVQLTAQVRGSAL